MVGMTYARTGTGFIRFGSFEQFVVIRLLDADEIFNTREVAELIALDGYRRSIPMARRYLSVLVKRGVIEEAKNPQDWREKAYTMTMDGYKFAKRLRNFTTDIRLKTWEMRN